MIVHLLELRCTYNTERDKQQKEADTTTSSQI
ncbi:hypothetical protein NC653_005727 [Populus alba x Populus x berolinensis]|uniref:Uncharacterized protein n=1 Tax=Populus alba x Populus x berolinensis TaxID=444605 RepID=A0AAD6RD11_9ROSI|nr:hypothetical protein NC653_005727 [Populus alba x Populus x berolinensis]